MTEPSTLTVYLVEDDDAHAELVTYAIEAVGKPLDIQRFRDGEEAWSHLTQSPSAALPALMLFDINMPRLGGIDLLKRVKSDDKLRQIPVVILTTSSSQHDRQEAFTACTNSYLVKPMSFELLAQMMRCTIEYWTQWNVPCEAFTSPN